MKRMEYLNLVSYTSIKSGISISRTKKIITELGKVIQNHVNSGYDVDIENICTIKYKASKMGSNFFIYNNEVKGLEEQIKDVAVNTNLPEYLIRKVLRFYFRRINAVISDGYAVTVKGIVSIIPRILEEENYFAEVTISPVLTKCKADNKLFTCLDSNGEINDVEIPKGNLRYELIISDNISKPNKAITEPIKLQTISFEELAQL